MRVAIYTRVSGKSNRQDAANQSLQLVEYCQRQGWDYIEYTDRMSGTRADRAAFVQMFEDAAAEAFRHRSLLGAGPLQSGRHLADASIPATPGHLRRGM